MSQTISLLQQLQRGKVLEESDNRLAELIHAIRDHGKSGKLTLEFEFRSLSSGTVSISGRVKCTAPSETQPPSIFFTTELDGLSRNNPEQVEMDLKAVEGGKTEIHHSTASAAIAVGAAAGL